MYTQNSVRIRHAMAQKGLLLLRLYRKLLWYYTLTKIVKDSIALLSPSSNLVSNLIKALNNQERHTSLWWGGPVKCPSEQECSGLSLPQMDTFLSPSLFKPGFPNSRSWEVTESQEDWYSGGISEYKVYKEVFNSLITLECILF